MEITLRTARIPSIVLAGMVALAACGSDAGSSDSTADAAGSSSPTGAIDVVASFYPLQFVTEQVGGDRVAVTNLTPPGSEPHDVELTPQDVKRLGNADLVVYLEGFSPAVDEAVAQGAEDQALEIGQVADLGLTYTPVEDGELGTAGQDVTDPHFWLDPTRLARVADQVAAELATLQPESADLFKANAATLAAELATLDRDLERGLADCSNENVVTSHNSFGYLAERYGLRQVGITGLTPDDEPTPQRLASLARFVKENGVTTIYYETLVSPAVAQTLADETGAATAVLDPLEGLSNDSPGDDYFSVMRANLASLRQGQACP